MYFLNINKPKGITSFDVIRTLRKKLKVKQIGHSGTLDPLASGVLQIAVGNACKLLDYLQSDKTYIADIIFGYISDTYDDEGEKEFVAVPEFSKDELIKVLNSFLGLTKQIPPKYSAIKIDGKKLCDIARKNPKEEIKIPEREIEIYSIELLNFENNFAKMKVHCKKGTYIRSLVNDIGLKLSCGAYMSDLVRTQAGEFNIESADLLEIENYNKINPINVLKYPIMELDDIEFEKVMNGNFIENRLDLKNDIILLTKNNKLVSISNLSDNLIKPRKNFREG